MRSMIIYNKLDVFDISLLGCYNRTLNLYVVTATNLGLLDLELMQRHRTARTSGPGGGYMRYRV
jgi:hypothetical protein